MRIKTRKMVHKFIKMRKITPIYTTSKSKEKKCWEIIHYLKLNKAYISKSNISSHFSISEDEFLSYVNYIRERNHSFFNPTNKKFMIDNKKGFKLSHNISEKKEFIKVLKKRMKIAGVDKDSFKSQLLEIKITCYN